MKEQRCLAAGLAVSFIRSPSGWPLVCKPIFKRPSSAPLNLASLRKRSNRLKIAAGLPGLQLENPQPCPPALPELQTLAGREEAPLPCPRPRAPLQQAHLWLTI